MTVRLINKEADDMYEYHGQMRRISDLILLAQHAFQKFEDLLNEERKRKLNRAESETLERLLDVASSWSRSDASADIDDALSGNPRTAGEVVDRITDFYEALGEHMDARRSVKAFQKKAQMHYNNLRQVLRHLENDHSKFLDDTREANLALPLPGYERYI